MSYRINRQATCVMFMIFWLAGLVGLDIYLITSTQVVTGFVQSQIITLLGTSFKMGSAQATLGGQVVMTELSYEVDGVPVITSPRAIVELDPVRGRAMSVALMEPKVFVDTKLLRKLDKGGSGGDVRIEGELPFMEVIGGALEFVDEALFAPGKSQIFNIKYISILQRPGQPMSIRGQVRSDLVGHWKFELMYSDEGLFASAECDDFNIGPDFSSQLSAKLREEFARIDPLGRAAIRVRIHAPRNQPTDVRVSVYPKGMSLAYVMFPYRLHDVEGELEFNLKGFIIKHATASTTGGKVFMSGICDDYAKAGWFKFDLRIDGMELDQRLLQACSPNLRKTIESMEGRGKVALHGYIIKKEGEDAPVETPVIVRLLGCRARLKAFPYELTNLQGLLDIDSPTVRINRITGESGDAKFEVTGQALIPDEGLELDISVRGRNVPFDSKLRAALKDRAQEIFDTFRPVGTFDIDWKLTKSLFGDELHSFRANLLQARITHQALPLPLTDLVGEVEGRIDSEHMDVYWHSMKGRYETCEIESVGQVRENGSGTVTEYEVRAVGLPFTQKVFEALPKEMSEILSSAKLKGTGNLRARLKEETSIGRRAVIASPTIRSHMISPRWFRLTGRRPSVIEHAGFDIELKLSRAAMDMKVPITDLDGFVRVTGQTLDDGHYGVLGTLEFNNARILGKRFNRLSGSLSYDHNMVSLSGVLGTLYDGVLTGRLSYDLATKQYTAAVKVSGVELREFKQDTEGYNQKAISGRVTINLPEIRGVVGKTETVTGKGDLEIWDADLWEVPVFLRMFTLDPTKWGTKSNFNAGIVKFEAKNDKIEIRSVIFKSEDAYLYGSGYIDFNWNLDVVLKVESKILGDFWLFKPIDFIFNSFQAAFLGVQVKGPFENPEVTPKMFPARPLRE